MLLLFTPFTGSSLLLLHLPTLYLYLSRAIGSQQPELGSPFYFDKFWPVYTKQVDQYIQIWTKFGMSSNLERIKIIFSAKIFLYLISILIIILLRNFYGKKIRINII